MLDESYLDNLKTRLEELEAQLSQPEVTRNIKHYQSLLADHARIKDLRERARHFFDLQREHAESVVLRDDPETDPELKEMAETELARIEEELPPAERRFMVAMLPPDPDDNRSAIVEIRAGTGGDEAALFAGDLYRMYCRYAEAMNWSVGLVEASPSSLGGYKEVVFSVEGPNVYGRMRFESGGHRVQRIPATESQGRIHTSAATVAVLPEAEAVDELDIKPEELRIDIFRASGPGGQSVNTTDSAVRITHLETGLVVQSQDERSQHRNKDKAMRVLRARLLDLKREQENARVADTRRNLIGSGDRSERIRTYNFPQNRLTDHRINLTLYSLDRVMEGGLEELIDTLSEQRVATRLAAEALAQGGETASP